MSTLRHLLSPPAFRPITWIGTGWLIACAVTTVQVIDARGRQWEASERYRSTTVTVISQVPIGDDATRVTYEYDVDGIHYVAQRYSWLGDAPIPDAHTPAVRYRPGTEVTGWYDPEAPSVSVLDPTRPRSGGVLAALPFFWIAGGFMVGVGLRSSLRAQLPARPDTPTEPPPEALVPLPEAPEAPVGIQLPDPSVTSGSS